MFKIKNLRTGNFAKNAIDRKVFTFDTKDLAEKFAASMNVFAAVDRKRDRFVAVTA